MGNSLYSDHFQKRIREQIALYFHVIMDINRLFYLLIWNQLLDF